MTQAAVQRTMTASDWALLAVLSLIWGGSFLFVGVAVRELPPLTIVATRVLTAALALLLVLRVMGVSLPRTRQAWAAFLGMSILNNVIPFTLIVWGQTHIASGLASILNATTPLFTVIVAHYLTADEHLTGQKFAGVIVGFIGVAVMIGFAAMASWDATILAQLAILGAVFGRRFKTMGIPPLATAAGQVTMSSMLLLPMALIVDRPWTLAMPSTEAVLSLVALGLVSTAVAYLIFFRLLACAGATNVGLVTFLIPVSAILLGVLILGETLAVRHIIGMALIGAGLILIDGRAISALNARFTASASGRKVVPVFGAEGCAIQEKEHRN
ncbi:MAG: transporter permease [Microvirga sp.]|nr:transporter permease [Microvirga sp.]